MARHKAGAKRIQSTRTENTVITPPLPPAPEKGLLKVRLPPTAKNGTIPSVYAPEITGNVCITRESSVKTDSSCSTSVKRVRICIGELDNNNNNNSDNNSDNGSKFSCLAAAAESDTNMTYDQASAKFTKNRNTKDVRTTSIKDRSDSIHNDEEQVRHLSELSSPSDDGNASIKENLRPLSDVNGFSHMSDSCTTSLPPSHHNPSWLSLGLNYQGFCPIAEQQYCIQRIRYSSLTPKDFFENFVKQRKPCILTIAQDELNAPLGTLPDGLEELMPLLRRWKDDDYLKTSAGSVMVDVEVRSHQESFGYGQHTQMKFSKVLNAISSGEENVYITTQRVKENKTGPLRLGGDLVLKTSLVNDYPNVPSIANTLIPYQYNIWLGSSTEGSKTVLHHDFHDNLYTLIRGKKTFRLFSPRLAEALGTEGTIRQIHPNGLICYDTARRCDGAEESSVYGWRASQAAGEIAILQTRLACIQDQMDQLRKLVGKESGKNLHKKKKKKTGAKAKTTLLNDSLIKQLAQTEGLQKEVLLSELNSKEESARLVREYIAAASQRKQKFEQLMLAALVRQELSQSVEDDESVTTSSNHNKSLCGVESKDDDDDIIPGLQTTMSENSELSVSTIVSSSPTGQLQQNNNLTSLDLLEESMTAADQKKTVKTQKNELLTTTIESNQQHNTIKDSIMSMNNESPDNENECWEYMDEDDNTALGTVNNNNVSETDELMKSALHENLSRSRPSHFCRFNTKSKEDCKPFLSLPDISPEFKTMEDVTQELLQNYYIEVTLYPNELLYLPAGWFHEVTSCNDLPQDSKSLKGHMAFNFWFYPPSTPNCDFEDPYPDEFWSRRFKKLLEVMQIEWQSQQLAALKSAGGVSLMRLLAGADFDPDSLLASPFLDAGNLLDYGEDDDDDDDDIDISDLDSDENMMHVLMSPKTNNNHTKKSGSKKKKKATKKTTKASNGNCVNDSVHHEYSHNSDTTEISPVMSEMHNKESSGQCNNHKSIREAYNKHMQLRSRGAFSS